MGDTRGIETVEIEGMVFQALYMRQLDVKCL